MYLYMSLCIICVYNINIYIYRYVCIYIYIQRYVCIYIYTYPRQTGTVSQVLQIVYLRHACLFRSLLKGNIYIQETLRCSFFPYQCISLFHSEPMIYFEAPLNYTKRYENQMGTYNLPQDYCNPNYMGQYNPGTNHQPREVQQPLLKWLL